MSPAVRPLQIGDVLRAARRAGGLLDRTVPDLVAQLVAAFVVVVLSWYLSQLFGQIFGRRMARRFRRPSVTRTIIRSARTLIVLTGAFSAAYILGIRVGNILVSVTVFSAVVGIVLAPIVGSIVNGLFVLADQPYEIGDMIELADSGQRGFVEDVTLRYTKMFTLDNTFLVIPNSSIRERDVVNYSAEDERTRRSLQVLVTYEGDLGQARELIERGARQVEGVVSGGPGIRIGAARYPAAPTCYVEEFGDHGILLTLRYWVEQPYKLLTIRSRVQSNVWDLLGEADVDVQMAYPHQHLVFDETSGEARVAVRNGDGRGDGHRGADADRSPHERPRHGGRSSGGSSLDSPVGRDGRSDDRGSPDGADGPPREDAGRTGGPDAGGTDAGGGDGTDGADPTE